MALFERKIVETGCNMVGVRCFQAGTAVANALWPLGRGKDYVWRVVFCWWRGEACNIYEDTFKVNSFVDSKIPLPP